MQKGSVSVQACLFNLQLKPSSNLLNKTSCSWLITLVIPGCFILPLFHLNVGTGTLSGRATRKLWRLNGGCWHCAHHLIMGPRGTTGTIRWGTKVIWWMAYTAFHICSVGRSRGRSVKKQEMNCTLERKISNVLMVVCPFIYLIWCRSVKLMVPQYILLLSLITETI